MGIVQDYVTFQVRLQNGSRVVQNEGRPALQFFFSLFAPGNVLRDTLDSNDFSIFVPDSVLRDMKCTFTAVRMDKSKIVLAVVSFPAKKEFIVSLGFRCIFR